LPHCVTLGVLHDINAIGGVNIALKPSCDVIELCDYFTDLRAITTSLMQGEVLSPMIQGILKKEVCGGCQKYINIGQSITECGNCPAAIYTKCYPKSKYSLVNNNYLCLHCQLEIPSQYNPFKNINDLADSDSDLFFDQNFSAFTGDLIDS
jgi:hypothetical protein